MAKSNDNIDAFQYAARGLKVDTPRPYKEVEDANKNNPYEELNNTLHEVVDETLKHVQQRIELMVVDDVVDIYKHRWENYGEYKNDVIKRIKDTNSDYLPILREEIFDYLVKKGEADGRD